MDCMRFCASILDSLDFRVGYDLFIGLEISTPKLDFDYCFANIVDSEQPEDWIVFLQLGFRLDRLNDLQSS